MNPYYFAVLRYRRSVVEGELVNIGIVMWLPGDGQFLFRLNERYGRLSRFYVGFDGESYRQMIRSLNQHFAALSGDEDQLKLFSTRSHELGEFLGRLIERDDSCFQWSQIMTGIHEHPENRLDELYRELVARYELAVRQRHDEEEIWQNVALSLQKAGLTPKITKDVEIKGRDYAYKFKTGWRNGVIQVLEPISFDLLRSTDILDKAATWSGRLFNLQTEQFNFTGIVSPPTRGDLQDDYRKAVRILTSSPRVRKILPESQIDEAIALIQKDVAETH